MDVYDTESREQQRDVTDEAARVLRRYGGVVKFFLGLAGVVLAGFGLRIVFENELGQVFGAMLIWFSILFGIAGVVFASAFYLRGKLRDLRA